MSIVNKFICLSVNMRVEVQTNEIWAIKQIGRNLSQKNAFFLWPNKAL